MKSFSKFLMVAIGTIAFISVGQARNGPPKNQTCIEIAHLVLSPAIVLVDRVAIAETAVVSSVDLVKAVKTVAAVKRDVACYFTVPERSEHSVVGFKKVFYDRNVSKISNNSDVIPRCRSSDFS